jgi:hypothetical protein
VRMCVKFGRLADLHTAQLLVIVSYMYVCMC